MGWFFSKKYTENEVYDLEAKGDVSQLIQIVKSESNYFKSYDSIKVRWAAIEALGNLGDKHAAVTLIGIINSTKWDGPYSDTISCRGMAATALGKIGDDRAIIPLIKILWQGNIKPGVEDAITEFGNSAIVPLLNQVKSRSVSINQYTGKPVNDPTHHFKDDPYCIHASSAKILGRIGDESAVEPLIKALIEYSKPSSNSSKARANIAMSLGNIGDKKAVEPLITSLKDKHADVRMNAAKSLKMIGDEQAIEPLIESLEDKVAKVRKASSESLLAFGKKDIVNEFNLKEKEKTKKKSGKTLNDLVDDFITNDRGNFGIPGMSERDMEFLGNPENKRLCMGCNEEIPVGHFKCLMCGSQSFYDVKRGKTGNKNPRRKKNKKTPLGQFSDGADTESLARGVTRPSKGLGKVLKEEAESLMTYYCNSCDYAFKMISMASNDYEQTCMKCGSSDLESESTPIESDDSVRSFMYE